MVPHRLVALVSSVWLARANGASRFRVGSDLLESRFSMYLSYYNLKRKPFQVSTDPKFLWLGQKHKDALATMKCGILYNYGYILIIGDVGTGKTTLVNALIEDLGDEVVLAKINDPGLEALDFFNLVLSTFKIVGRQNTKGTFLSTFNKFLQSCCANQKRSFL